MIRWLMVVGVMLSVIAVNAFHLEQFRAGFQERLLEERRKELSVFAGPAEAYYTNRTVENLERFAIANWDHAQNLRSRTEYSVSFRAERLDYLFGHRLWIAILLTALIAGGITWGLSAWVSHTREHPGWIGTLWLVAVLCFASAFRPESIWVMYPVTALVFGAMLAGYSRMGLWATSAQAVALLCSAVLLVCYAGIVWFYWDWHLHLLFGMGSGVNLDPYRPTKDNFLHLSFLLLLTALPAFLSAWISAFWRRRCRRRAIQG